jgi:DNA segregation ATPase FtsK/SpoIIIE, S-DNA-T family
LHRKTILSTNGYLQSVKVATQSEREFGLSVLRGLGGELERREQLFSNIGVQEIAVFRDKRPDVRMPRTLLLIDEFQELFTYDDKVAQEAGLLLDRLVRLGRGFGMHVLLGSQTLAGTYTVARSTISQMAVRIALQCSEADSRLILSDENPAARLLFRSGEAIYNAQNGLVEGNMPFQTALLPEEELDQLLQSLRSFANQPQMRQFLPAWEQRIFRGDANAEIEKSVEMRTMLFTPYREVANGGATLLLGEPTELKSATSVQLRNQAGNNVLLVGQRDEESLAVMHTMLLGLVAQHQSRTIKVCVADLSSTDSSGAGQLEKAARLFPHSIQVVNRRSLPALIAAASEEVTQRLNVENQGRPTIYLLIYGLQRARDLRPNDDYSSYSAFGSDDAASTSPAKQFATILRDGSELGVHTIAWCDSLANVNRTLERGALREFEVRVLFQMSADDSRDLCDSQAAAMLGAHRALLYNEETGHVEKFRPFGLPSDAWMQQIAGPAINQKNNVRA